MSMVYHVSWWSALLFALPLYTSRLGYQKLIEMRVMFTQTIGALAQAVDKRDPYTSQHSVNVKTISVEIGRAMRLGDADLEALEWGGLLHDVGKIGVPDSVLLKPGRLSAEEFSLIKTHTAIGARILGGSRVPLLQSAEEIAFTHHERWDGMGYNGLVGEQIPMAGRVVALVDTFDALTHARPYKTAWTFEEAFAEVRAQSGRQFDPEIVTAFMDVRAELPIEH
jgi:putative two-component system response regulator